MYSLNTNLMLILITDSKDEFYWKEITAAMALTDMSRMKSNL